jgi:hypothetical protein
LALELNLRAELHRLGFLSCALLLRCIGTDIQTLLFDSQKFGRGFLRKTKATEMLVGGMGRTAR